MHGLSRLSNGVSSVSPPSSPRRRGKSSGSVSPVGCIDSGGGDWVFRGGGGRGEVKNVVERLLYFLISAVYRKRGVLLFAPLLYVSGMLMYMGTFGFDAMNSSGGGNVGDGSGVGDVVGPGSVYRSPQVLEKLWPFMEADSNRSSNMVIFSFFAFLIFEEGLLRLERF